MEFKVTFSKNSKNLIFQAFGEGFEHIIIIMPNDKLYNEFKRLVTVTV